MTASGPFALGPALAGSSGRRSASTTSFVPSAPTRTSSSLSEGLSQTAAPSLKRDLSDKKGKLKVEEEETYSDPDEGVEIVDMEKVKQMDWMAPESLKRESGKRQKRVKIEEKDDEKASIQEDTEPAVTGLSDAEDEGELEDIIEDFTAHAAIEEDGVQEDRLYLFHFPYPFPSFTMPKNADIDLEPPQNAPPGKKVSFAPEQEPQASMSSQKPIAVETASTENSDKPNPVVDGAIGELLVYKSGAVKMRLTNGIILDVNTATQPSFLQQAVCLDKKHRRLTFLGEVNKQFVVSPNISALLDGLESEESESLLKGEQTMDTKYGLK
ncbi:hypothetical protein CVT24_006756 [Panaeolus cyanescens]|uniref:RNA polymerase III RPC4-domain-containing protein n=1 Tax=Panaeolus cyanescens TaxID=181874 RepID=A0A409V9D6_9AGAR|nr:hypothetical protein CVT24_006756 [Panaeolus cyanescens]